MADYGSRLAGCKTFSLWSYFPERFRFGRLPNTKGNSAFYPSGVGKWSTGLSGWGYDRARSYTSVVGNTLCNSIWQVMLRSYAVGFP